LAVVFLTDPYSIQDWRAAILPLLDNSLFRTYARLDAIELTLNLLLSKDEGPVS
jgi:hypothetical protein